VWTRDLFQNDAGDESKEDVKALTHLVVLALVLTEQSEVVELLCHIRMILAQHLHTTPTRQHQQRSDTATCQLSTSAT